MQEGTSDRNRRILVIDDNPQIHDDFRKILAGSHASEGLDAVETALFGDTDSGGVDEGYEIDAAHQGQEGVAMVEQALCAGRPYALAFVDVRMPPGWDGIETIRRLWGKDPAVQVVICTAFSDYGWSEINQQLGERRSQLLFVKKPFDSAEISQLAAALTEKYDLAVQSRLKMGQLEGIVEQRTRSLRENNERLEREIVERERAQQELAQARKLESIGHLAAGIAHEINTPAQYVGHSLQFLQDAFKDIEFLLGGLGQLLKATKRGSLNDKLLAELEAAVREADVDYLTEEIPRAIEQSLEGVGRVSNIVQAMKDFSYPANEKKQAIDLNRAIDSTLTISRHEWHSVSELVTDFDTNLPLVPCRPGEINQVVLNLVVNAAHAIAEVVGEDSQGKGTLVIRTRRDGDWAQIQIEDTGTGIPEGIRENVFDQFFTTKDVGKGTGQGLSIAHSVVVEKHGGTISFETEVGRGTTFIVRLPITEVADLSHAV
jgi:two-component system NtrC family sensor kinase